MDMRGVLLNKSANGRQDVFDGYAVEVAYAVRASDALTRAYRDVDDRVVLSNGDNRFEFDLPDEELARDKPIRISVRARSGKVAHRSERSLDQLIRAEGRIEIVLQEVEPLPVLTPVNVRGQLQWRDEPQRTEGFAGFRVVASFEARPDAQSVYVPQQVSLTLNSAAFTLDLPAREHLRDALVVVSAQYPSGIAADSQSFAVETLRQAVTLVVAEQRPPVIRSNAQAQASVPQRLKGKAVDLAGQTVLKNRQVIVWGQSAQGEVRPVIVATTDGAGNFSGAWPHTKFVKAYGTVSGTRNATPDQGLWIDLEPVAPGEGEPEQAQGALPKFVYLVASPLPETEGEEEDCACNDAPPRQPDAEDLVDNPGAYSQDIGPNCVNFTMPNRTLEEFVYTLVVRTTDPMIKGTTISDLERRDVLEHGLLRRAEATKLIQSGATFRELASTTSSSLAEAHAISVSHATSPSIKSIATTTAPKLTNEARRVPGWFNELKEVSSRGELSARNSVDWDGAPTFYQATDIAHGHILYYKQIWKADGYSLGDLLYSLPLAPGQKKQIVIFDWDRNEYGRRDEDTHEDEALNAYLGHTRDILDITRGNVSEQMQGGSSSRTSGSAGGVGGGIGALLGPVMIGVAGGYSTSSGSASSSAWQNSSRDVSATGMNQLRDFIQQGASSVRNQRSTVVQTARQSERFRVETEVVANHNHCHAITIEYFEVLRHYAIEQKLTHVQECLFVPLLMSAFDIAKIMRWRDILRGTLLIPRRTGLFGLSLRHPLHRGIDAVERIYLNDYGDYPATTYAAENVISLSGELRITFRLNRPLDGDDNADDPARQESLMVPATFMSAGTAWSMWGLLLDVGDFYQYFANQKVKYKNKIFEERVAPELAAKLVDQLEFFAVSESGDHYKLDLDPTLVSNYVRDAELFVTVQPRGEIKLHRDQIASIKITTAVDLSASANSKIIVQTASFRYTTAHMNGYLVQDVRVQNDLLPNDPVKIPTPLSTEEKRNPRKEDEHFSQLLIEHLNANLEYYHKTIWQRMDPDRRYMLLDGFLAPHAAGRSVASVVENRVIGVAGNSLIMPVAPGYKLDPTYRYAPKLDESGEPLLNESGQPLYEETTLLDHYRPLTPAPPYRVSVPTRGVFAESVMGACNSCERWDNKRYWKWEEHPIPDEPTPIEPIQTQPPQRSDPGDLKPTPFPAPMINIQNAPSAPDPGATVAGALGLLGKSDLFKDITGLDQTQKNALQAMLSNQESAKHFADTAAQLALQSANLKSGPTTIDSIKASVRDGTLDKSTGQKLIEEAYRTQISGKPTAEQRDNTAVRSPLGEAAAEAVKDGREVKASQTHPDGTQTKVEQRKNPPTEGSGAAVLHSSSLTLQGAATVSGQRFQNADQINKYFSDGFIDWFLKNHANKGEFIGKTISGADGYDHINMPPDVVKANFIAFWDRLEVIFDKPAITLIEFLALMTSAINERNGNLVSLPEGGHSTPLSFYYITIEHVKDSYNKSPNKTAQECFKNDDYIAAHELSGDGTKKPYAELARIATDIWASTTQYPTGYEKNPSPEKAGFIREADFYKFRGRGVIQTTWRNGYAALINFILDYRGDVDIINKYRDWWTYRVNGNSRNEVVDKIAYITTNEDWDFLFSDLYFLAKAVNIYGAARHSCFNLATTADGLNAIGQTPGSIYFVGSSLNGPGYATKFRARVLQLANACIDGMR